MLCPRCYGKRVVVLNGSRIPCPECAGVGELHCCDGLREQDDCPVTPSNRRREPAAFVDQSGLRSPPAS